MKYLPVISALLLSASPAVAQYNANKNCIMNKDSEMQRYERLYQTDYQATLKPVNNIEIARY